MAQVLSSVAKPFIGAGYNKLFGIGDKNKEVLNFARPYDLGAPLSFSGDLGAGALGIDYARPNLRGFNSTGGGYKFGVTLNPDGTVAGGLDSAGSPGAAAFGSRFGRGLTDIDALRSGLTPGFGKVTQARRDAIENARLKATGDLRDTLARRRIEGSSFGNASMSQQQAEFAKATAEADAQSYLQELDATTKLLAQEFDQTLKARAADFAELGFSTQQIAQFSDAATRDAQIRMQFAEQDLASRRSLAGQDAASRRGAGVADVTNRRELAAREEVGAGKAAGAFAEDVTSGFMKWVNPFGNIFK